MPLESFTTHSWRVRSKISQNPWCAADIPPRTCPSRTACRMKCMALAPDNHLPTWQALGICCPAQFLTASSPFCTRVRQPFSRPADHKGTLLRMRGRGIKEAGSQQLEQILARTEGCCPERCHQHLPAASSMTSFGRPLKHIHTHIAACSGAFARSILLPMLDMQLGYLREYYIS